MLMVGEPTILTLAVRSGSKETYEAVLTLLDDTFGSDSEEVSRKT